METVGQIIEFTATKDSKPGDVSLSIPLQPATKDSKPGDVSLVDETSTSLISSVAHSCCKPTSLVADTSLPSSLVAETKRECTTCGKSKYLKNFYENRSECSVCRKSMRRVRRANCFAIPKWLTKEHYSQMEDLYRRAMDMRERGIDVEVDHMEPLYGADRCGLHVPWNLQILAHDINAQKGNMGYAEWCAIRRTHKIRNMKPTKMVLK